MHAGSILGPREDSRWLHFWAKRYCKRGEKAQFLSSSLAPPTQQLVFCTQTLEVCGLKCLLKSRMWVWRGMWYIKPVSRSVQGRWLFLVQKQLLAALKKKEKARPRKKTNQPTNQQTAQRLLRDSRTLSRLSEDTTFHTGKIRRGLEDAASL